MSIRKSSSAPAQLCRLDQEETFKKICSFANFYMLYFKGQQKFLSLGQYYQKVETSTRLKRQKVIKNFYNNL